jgi:hypothetical protein
MQNLSLLSTTAVGRDLHIRSRCRAAAILRYAAVARDPADGLGRRHATRRINAKVEVVINLQSTVTPAGFGWQLRLSYRRAQQLSAALVTSAVKDL